MKSTPGAFNGWDYDTDMAFQSGDARGLDLSSFAGHWGVGYTWANHAWKPRLGVEYNYAQFETKSYQLNNTQAGASYAFDAKPRDIQSVVGRLSYKFGGPIVARY